MRLEQPSASQTEIDEQLHTLRTNVNTAETSAQATAMGDQTEQNNEGPAQVDGGAGSVSITEAKEDGPFGGQKAPSARRKAIESPQTRMEDSSGESLVPSETSDRGDITDEAESEHGYMLDHDGGTMTAVPAHRCRNQSTTIRIVPFRTVCPAQRSLRGSGNAPARRPPPPLTAD